ncbi:vanin-like protein 1 isoform X3 [Zerene cesonia]|uniref:vanin-like protein 1 isoform X3 n=1 Tax=Zerene cesonia TaxID=33412 RepID=UPI0018E58DF6|nr:vanin-like protein 1 isoform X3 [Zerene cesonia]
MKSLILLAFFCFLIGSEQISTPSDDSYVAAVVEYEVLSNTDTNIANYIRIIKEASEQNADIVVFPEMTLNRGNRNVEVPIYGRLKEYPVPALHEDLYDSILVSMSSAARNNRIYVVINVQEEMNCANAPGEECPENKVYLFNTDVVFDRNGAVIDRYRKINLFGEFTRTPALKPELGIFTTDFGVTFGHFICFDLMFQVPAVQLPQKHNVTDVIFPTMWFSEMPYLTAVQIQEAYAYAMNVNFLAAGANNVRIGSAGSGIYSGKAGALISIMPGVPTTRLLVAKVPKVPGEVKDAYPGPIYDNPSDHDNLLLKVDPSLASHRSRLLQPGLQEFTLVDGTTTCRFKVSLSESPNTKLKYRAFVHDRIQAYVKREAGVAGCVVTACQSEDPTTCPYRFSKDTKIEIQELDIKMSSHPLKYNSTLKCNDVEYYAMSFRNNKFPLNPSNYSIQVQQDGEYFTQNGDETTLLYKLKGPQTDLVSFGIWGRVYNEDNNPKVDVTIDDVNSYYEIENIIYGLTNKKTDL